MLFTGIFLAKKRILINVMCRALRLGEESRRDASETVLRMMESRTLIFNSLLLSFLYYGICIAFSALILASLDTGITPLLGLSLPVLALFGNAPITISGLGVRETASSAYFGSFGYPLEYGFSFSILWFLVITVFPGIIGYILILAERRK